MRQENSTTWRLIDLLKIESSKTISLKYQRKITVQFLSEKVPEFRSADHWSLKNLHHIWVIFIVLTQKEVFFILWLFFLFFGAQKLEQIKMQIYMFCANKKLSSKKETTFLFDFWYLSYRWPKNGQVWNISFYTSREQTGSRQEGHVTVSLRHGSRNFNFLTLEFFFWKRVNTDGIAEFYFFSMTSAVP